MTPYRHRLPAAVLIAQSTKGLRRVERWNAAEFRLQGRALMVALHRMARISQAKAAIEIAKIANALFKRQIEQVVYIATSGTVKPGKAADMAYPQAVVAAQSIDVWDRAIQEVFGREATVDTVLQLLKPIRSMLDQGYTRTATVLQNPIPPRPMVHPQIQRDAEQIAQRITNIPNTTRAVLRREIEKSIAENENIVETAIRVLDKMPKRDESRALTIARTETNNAYTRGAIIGFEENGDVLEVSVIGCSQVEQNWLWNGKPTCNIEGVPIGSARELEWHPNHVGTLVASKFRE